MTKHVLSHSWKVLRAIVSVALLVVLLLPAGVYIALSTPGVQDAIKTTASKELGTLLGAPVEIGQLGIRPFSRVDLRDVRVMDPSAPKEAMASVRGVSARFELYHFLRTGRIIIDYALLEGLDVRLSRATPDSPLNIQPVIDALKVDGKKKQPAHFRLRISNVAILDGSFSYDVASEARRQGPDGRPIFDPSHIRVTGVELNAYAPRISNERYAIDLAHLSFRESSGFELLGLEAEVKADSTEARVEGLSLRLPASTLSFAPISLKWPGLGKIAEALERERLEVRTSGVNTLCPADLRAFVPALGAFPEPLSVNIDASADKKGAELRELRIFDSVNPGRLSLTLRGEARARRDSTELPAINVRELILTALPKELLARIPGAPKGPVREAAASLGSIQLTGEGSMSPEGNAHLDADLRSSLAGNVTLKASGKLSAGFRPVTADLEAAAERLEIGAILGIRELGAVTATVEAGARWAGRKKYPSCEALIDIQDAIYNGTHLGNISAEGHFDGTTDGSVKFTSDNAALIADLSADFSTGTKKMAPALLFDGSVSAFRPGELGLKMMHEGSVISGRLHADLEGREADTLAGEIRLSDLRWTRAEGEPLVIDEMEINASPYSSVPFISVSSPIIKGEIKGRYSFPAMAEDIKCLLGEAVPALVSASGAKEADYGKNDFSYEFEISDARNAAEFFGLPVVPVYPIEITGHLHGPSGTAAANIDAPYLRQGDKLIQGTMASVFLDRSKGRAAAYVATEMPTKKGQMQIDLSALATDNKINTQADWTILRTIPINGRVDLTTELARDENRELTATVHTNPGSITFGDDIWQIRPSTISYKSKKIEIKDFRLDSGTQHIAADGRAGALSEDSLTLRLTDVSLLPVFETLEIDKALIGGRATGTFTASQVLSSEPVLACRRLHVDSIGYNRCTLGNADIAAAWDNEKKAFTLDADIVEPEGGRHSRIWGDIYPMTESLDMNFEANHVRVGFMQPFMEAFASNITGYASGTARLFGTFKEIDMTGRILAENLGINIDITNTRYFATDSIILSPGRIDLRDITIRDINGHTAHLGGWLKHTYFKQPVFDFRVTDARELLCFNGTSKQNPDWYGTVYGNGGATIQGWPGVVDIGVNMATTAGSNFTFVLSDRLDAEEYSFITFRNVTPVSREDSLRRAADALPADVRRLMEGRTDENAEEASAYNMDIHVAITPEARMTLVMDPVGGDEIRAYGEGNMRLTYHSVDNSINMWGNYTLDRGSYNFTLQDIIIKDFTIKPGSTISFNGDPYAAEANLQAYYAVNANLSDLDESFLQDKELNRTNVPVHALMKVTGDIRQPDIDFDLEFPTLTQDTYRKVRSIVSTSDMMNRQIIYLLALNRFYTPDYMASTTKGSELFSVASSTISSQLSSMLGKLSENWSIAPNLRSDRGDFSDVEVDVALSSRLLNNRLLFNGNFGYRDKSLNTNQFIGDFDIEYLLNKRGSWRLKAYNRYNDQNYYLRTAQTTQGVGIMFRKDFDNLFSFLRKRRKPAGSDSAANPADSVKTETKNDR